MTSVGLSDDKCCWVWLQVDPNPPALTGALAAGCGRRTMSQQSVAAGWTHVLQLELSHTVRP